MLSGLLTVTSVDPVSGEELVAGELVTPGTRGALTFRSTRGDSLATRDTGLAHRVVTRLRELDAEHGGPVRARFDVSGSVESLRGVEPAALSPLGLVRVLVERVRDGRLARTHALARITPAELEAAGTYALEAPPPAPIAHGLAASAGAAAGRLALPADVTGASDGEPRVLVIDDAGPEDADAIRKAVAILATSGGLTADAAIAARALRKPCVVSTPLRMGDRDHPARGDWVTVDGTRGDVHVGRFPTRWAAATPFAAELVAWLAPEASERPGEALLRARNALAQGAAG